MTRFSQSALCLCVLAGGVVGLAGAEESPTKLEPVRAEIVKVAHIYFNAATGDRVVTLVGDGQTAGADVGSSPAVWSTVDGSGCVIGSSPLFYHVVDNNNNSTSLATGAIVSDWGDIPVDTVVDCVSLNWVTDHQDVDLNSDGIGDGVPGLAGEWSFWDTDNGRGIQQSMRLPLLTLRFLDLPADITPREDNTVATYSIDVDLSAPMMSSSLVFEIGDSDGDGQGAAVFHNNVDIDGDGIGDGYSVADTSTDGVGGLIVDRNGDGMPDDDLDGDGLFDWSWSVRFFQPGTADIDGDGTIDGLFDDGFRPIGVLFGFAEGTPSSFWDGTDFIWSWDIDLAADPNGAGHEDVISYVNQSGNYIGTFWFGGFDCDFIDPKPYAGFQMALYGHNADHPLGPCSPADLKEPYGVLNFFDVSTFLSEFTSQDDSADLAAPFGVWNFFDVSEFLSLFAAGCP